MRIIAMKTEAKLYEVMRGAKSTLMKGDNYQALITRPGGLDSLGNPYDVAVGRGAGLPTEHSDPSIMSKFFHLEVRPENGKDMSDEAVITIAKDLDKIVLGMMSKGGVYLELLKDLKSHKGAFPIVIVAEDSGTYSTMFQLDGNKGSYGRSMEYKTSTGVIKVDRESVFLKLSYKRDGKPLFRPAQHSHVVIHELMHKLDLVTSSKSMAVKTLVSALRKNPIYTSDYSKTNDKEMIAELLAFYYLKSNYPEYKAQYAKLEKIASDNKIVISKR